MVTSGCGEMKCRFVFLAVSVNVGAVAKKEGDGWRLAEGRRPHQRRSTGMVSFVDVYKRNHEIRLAENVTLKLAQRDTRHLKTE
jgi:hypothetical protein